MAVPDRERVPAAETLCARVLVAMGGIPLYGQERGNIQVFHALREVGVDALFVTHKRYGHESVQPELDRLDLAWTVGTYPGFWSFRSGPAAVRRQIREVADGNADFVRAAQAYRPTHVHMMNERYFLNLLPAVRRLGLPVVYRVGDRPRQHNVFYRFVWRRLLVPQVTEFVCISDYIRGHVLAAGAPPERTRVIRNAPPERGQTPSDLPGDLRETAPGLQTVLYVGQISAEKGVDVLVDAASALCRTRADVRFLLAGDYSWQNPFAEALIARVEADGLADRIRFLGFRSDVEGLFDLADVHVAPSRCHEALGNVVVEAKRACVPSVVFRDGGLPELVVDDGRDGFVCPSPTAEGLTAGIVHYLDMDASRRAATRAAARDSLEVLGLTPAAFAAQWSEVYRTPQPALAPPS